MRAPARRSGIAGIALVIASCGALDAAAAPPSVATGSFHSLAVRSDGRVLAWGNDSTGQLGQGRLLSRSAPEAVAGTAGAGVVAAGSAFGVAVTQQGEVLAWGANDGGQLGDGSFAYRGNTVVRARVSGVAQVAAARATVTALRSDGSVWTWGARPLGDGSATERATPAAIGLDDVVQVSASSTHTLAVKRDGTVWGWGNPFELDFSGASSLPGDLYYRATRLPPLSEVRFAAAGEGYTLLVKNDGTLWGWGSNFWGTLGAIAGERVPLPTRIPDVPAGIRAIAAAQTHVLALRDDGTVLSWGKNNRGQLGRGSTEGNASMPPAVIPGLSGIVAIAAGGAHSLALGSDGSVWAWGENGSQQAGQPSGSLLSTPTRVPGMAGVQAIAARENFSFAIVAGVVHGWGDNSRQQLASGPARPLDQTVPILVPGIDDVVMVAGGTWNSYALRSDGTLWGWGLNPVAVTGARTHVVASPVQIPALPRIVAISARATYVLALDDQGRVWSWGENIFGQLGNGTTTGSFTPAPIQASERVAAISAGYSHALALTVSGRVLGWGLNHQGQLGDGTTTDRLSPTYVMGLPTVDAVSAGAEFSLAKTAGGDAWAWGSARNGALGLGFDIDRLSYPTPQRITTLSQVRLIAAGGNFAMAVTSGGTLWGWGQGAFGQLGFGSGEGLLSRYSPERLPIETPVDAIAPSGLFALALSGDAAVIGFGWNTDAELGDGTLVDRNTPVLTAGLDGAGFLDLTPENPASPPAALRPRFGVAIFGDAKASTVNVDARVFFNAADVGTTASVFVFAIAPADLLRGGAADAMPVRMQAKRGGKDLPVQCVLAQLNASGQLVGVSAASLLAYLTGVLSSQGQAVSIINGVPAANIGGATFFVGYGPNGSAMLNGGNNRGVVTLGGPTTCKPEAPQTGWWWNPLEDGRGFSIEKRGNNLFFASFLYDVSGRSSWYVSSGPVSLDGSLYIGSLLSARGGQTLGGPYPGFPQLRDEGPLTLAFNTASSGTLVWPGGTVPIQRFNIVPGGLTAPAAAGTPESGWWWNESEAGRGFFMEWQNGSLDIAGYMYDDQGNPVWYLTVGEIGGTSAARSFGGTWWSYGNGMTLSGPWRQHTRTNANVAPVTITFTGADTALMTLPNGRSTQLRRHRF